jgi:hypothetical protein
MADTLAELVRNLLIEQAFAQYHQDAHLLRRQCGEAAGKLVSLGIAGSGIGFILRRPDVAAQKTATAWRMVSADKDLGM